MSKNGSPVKVQNRIKIAKYIQSRRLASRTEIAASLGYSMPTVFANVAALTELGLLCETGEYGSTGGRKAKGLAICKDFRSVAGVDITTRHVRFLLLDLSGDVLASEYRRLDFCDTTEYYQELSRRLEAFLDEHDCLREKLIGVGISVPGILSHERDLLVRSHILNVQNVSLKRFTVNIPYPCIIDNDANCAAFAEIDQTEITAYFSLSNSVGGAVYVNGALSGGERNKSGEFGHMIIRPNGKRCYCGKKGCLDAYCAARVLEEENGRLEDFFDRLDSGDAVCRKKWAAYLDNLALAICNIRMALDCRIVLGGTIGGYLEQRLPELWEYLSAYNNFDTDMSYIGTGKYKRLSSAIGAAQMVIDAYLDRLEE